MAASDRPEFELKAPSSAVSVGEQLRNARSQLGLTVEAVAKQLKLAPRQVIAMEADDYANLPPGPFLRGFIRNYARLVNLDPDQLLGQDGSRRLALSPLAATPPTRGELPESGPRPSGGIMKWVIPVGLVAAVLIAATWYESRRPKPATDATLSTPGSTTPPQPLTAAGPTPPAETAARVPTAQVPATASPAPAPAASTPAANPGSTEPAAAAPTAVTAPNAASTAAGAASLGAAAPETVAAVGAVPAPGAAAPAAPKQPSSVALELTFSDQAWTEIRDAAGKVLTSKTHAKGTKLTVSGQPPFRFIIGNARTVTLTRDGTPVDLNPRIGAGDVAKFTLH